MSKRKDISGIYKITSPSGSIYIGRSYRINERWRCYRRMDCRMQHKLFASFAKYGTLNHTFEIIHELPNDVSKDVIESYESIYYDLYKDCGLTFMNIAATGKGIGRLLESQSRKIGDIHKGRSSWNKGMFGGKHNRSINITCNGVEYGSMAEASRQTGVALSSIHHSVSTNKPLRSGMHFQISKI